MRSLKYYSEDLYVKKLKEIDFPEYSNIKDINEAYSDFTGKVASVIDEIAPIIPTRITNNSSSLLDHILTNSADRISQFGIINVGLSDHQLIYCTRKITRTRLNTHKYVKMRSLKYYSEDLYVKKLKEIDFPEYSNIKDINEAYSDFTGKVASVIDEIAPIKEVRVKSNSQDWFDAEINEEIERRDKLLTKFKKSRSHSDNENYKKSRNKVQRMIKDKTKNFVIGKLNDNIGKPKNFGNP